MSNRISDENSSVFPLKARYVVISPCRNEEAYMRTTIESVIRQTILPSLWILVDDGSTDQTPEIIKEYAARFAWIRAVSRPDRGCRAVGRGVVESFYDGLALVDLNKFEFICKLDLDLELPEKYFETLLTEMEKDPRLGSCSGKPYVRTPSGSLSSEYCGDEMSVGMTKFCRVECFLEIGGFVNEVMWDAIDCHKARQIGWKVRSWDNIDLRFIHLRPMGSSQGSIIIGRQRHGWGQYYMGSDPLFFLASIIFRMFRPPYFVGGLAMAWGYVRAWIEDTPQYEDAELRAFIKSYQRRALIVGKTRAVAEIENKGD